MSKDVVLIEMGNPQVVRGSIKNQFDQIVEVWEYHLQLPLSGEDTGEYITLALLTFGLTLPLDMHTYKDYQSHIMKTSNRVT